MNFPQRGGATVIVESVWWRCEALKARRYVWALSFSGLCATANSENKIHQDMEPKNKNTTDRSHKRQHAQPTALLRSPQHDYCSINLSFSCMSNKNMVRLCHPMPCSLPYRRQRAGPSSAFQDQEPEATNCYCSPSSCRLSPSPLPSLLPRGCWLTLSVAHSPLLSVVCRPQV